MHTNIQKWGNSQAIRLPKPIMETAFFKENEKVEIFAEKDQIIIKKATRAPHKTLEERLSNFNGKYECKEWDTGSPVGKEVL